MEARAELAIPPLPAQPWRRALGASAIDLLLATGLVFGLSIVGVAGWALVRGVRLGMADGAATDPQQVAAQLGQPQGMTLVLISVLATASAAVALYFWRRPAGAGERAASHAAARDRQSVG